MAETFENGYPFSDPLPENIDYHVDRVEKNKAVLILIDGGVGEGKTTLLVELLDTINKKHGLPEIDLEGAQLAMGGADFLKKIRKCYEEKLPCIGYDEAGDFSKRGSLSNFNAMLNRTFETFRAFKCIVILALPNFNVLDNQLFDNQIPRFLIHCHNREVEYGNYSVYDLGQIAWLRYYLAKLPIKATAWNAVYPNFVGHFKNLPLQRREQLNKISIKNKLSILRKSEVRIEGLVTYPEMATKLNRSIDWVRHSISNLKIAPVRRIGRIAYFDQNTINLLITHLENVESIAIDKVLKRRAGMT